jgi:transposase
MEKDRISTSRRERDVKVLSVVLAGKRTQPEAGRLIGRSERQVRRLLVRLREKGDAALIHGLRGRPSNHQSKASTRRRLQSARSVRT